MNSIYNYLDPINYISDYITHQKKLDDSFSIRKWSKTLNLNSPIGLIDVLNKKKKLRGKIFNLLIENLPIDNSEKMYFHVITERSQTEEKEKIKVYDLIIKELTPYKIEDYSCKRINSEVNIYSHWIYMAILSMTNLSKFSLTPENIQKKLKEKLPLEFIENSLEELSEYGLLELSEKGEFKTKYSSCTTKTDKRNQSVDLYYSTVCDLAKKAIFYNLEEREFQSFSVAIPHDSIPLAKEIIRKARAQLVSLGSENIEKNDVVYQGNLQFFPLTK